MVELAPLGSLSAPPETARPVTPAGQRPAAPFAPVLSSGQPGTTAGAEGLGERFEAAVLTPLVSAILPPEDSSVWGGQAGKLWRGLFAEEIAASTARSGGVGIAEMIDDAIASRYQPAPGEE